MALNAAAATVIAGAAQSGMTLSGNIMSAISTHKNRDYNYAMANSAYQRQVADLKAAGLNPAYGMSDGGAASPNTPAATYDFSTAGNQLASAIQAAGQRKLLEKQISNVETDSGLKTAQADAAEAQSWANAGTALEKLANVNYLKAMEKKVKEDTKVSSAAAVNEQIYNTINDLTAIKANAEKGLYKGTGGKIIAITDKALDYWDRIIGRTPLPIKRSKR